VAGATTPHATSDPSSIWVERYEAGGFGDDVTAAATIQEYRVRIAALERLVGW
jgi:hypothetical protein